jgi:hypothetical protein
MYRTGPNLFFMCFAISAMSIVICNDIRIDDVTEQAVNQYRLK